MPIPTPKNEEEDEFMSRCMSDKNMQEYDQKQRAAICHSKFKNKKKRAKGKNVVWDTEDSYLISNK